MAGSTVWTDYDQPLPPSRVHVFQTSLDPPITQDIPLSSTILVLIGFLVLLGTLIADILLAWLDPRIRYT